GNARNHQRFPLATPDAPFHDQASDRYGRKEGSHQAYADRNGKAPDRAAAKQEQQADRDQSSEVGIQNRSVGLAEALSEGHPGGLATAGFFTDTLIDQDIGIHRHANSEYNSGNPRQGQGRPQQAQYPEHQPDVHCQPDTGDQSPSSVKPYHESNHHGCAQQTGGQPHGDGIAAQIRADGTFLDHMQRRGQGARSQQQSQVTGFFCGKPTADLSTSANGAADDRRGNHFTIQHDGQGPTDVVPGHIPEQPGTLVVQFEIDHRLVGIR